MTTVYEVHANLNGTRIEYAFQDIEKRDRYLSSCKYSLGDKFTYRCEDVEYPEEEYIIR